MALMIGELYDALRAAGVDPDLARRAAEEVYQERHPRRLTDNHWLGLVIAEAVVIFVLIGLLARGQ